MIAAEKKIHRRLSTQKFDNNPGYVAVSALYILYSALTDTE
jgi:hypothetical protein